MKNWVSGLGRYSGLKSAGPSDQLALHLPLCSLSFATHILRVCFIGHTALWLFADLSVSHNRSGAPSELNLFLSLQTN